MNGFSLRFGVVAGVILLGVAGTPRVGLASGGEPGVAGVGQGKAKATRAAVVARRDALLKGRDALRKVAAMPAPKGLDAVGKKGFDELVAGMLEVARGCEVTAGKLTEGLKAEKPAFEALSEMGEMESLRLQMAMDRKSKEMSTLSNLLKKMSDTASEIVQNMK